jgi:hypothetical protein
MVKQFIKRIFPFVKYRYRIYEIYGKLTGNADSISMNRYLVGVYRSVIFFIRRQRIATMVLGPVFERSRTRIEIDITYKCNLKCSSCNRSCPQAPADERMTVEQIRKFVKESIGSNVRWESIAILGGEPTLHPDLLEIINILSQYKKQYSPNLELIVSTNGSGDFVKQMIDKIPKTLILDNSSKEKKGIRHIAFNDAPSDHAWNVFVDYSNGCYVTSSCGMGLTPYGYYCCPIAGAIDRVFGFNMGLKNLPSDENSMKDQLSHFCKLCGHFLEDLRFSRNKISPVWQAAYSQYHINKPSLSLY